MDANTLHTLFGCDEPDFMYLTGATIKALAAEIGEPLHPDDRGDLLQDDELYCVTQQGTFRVED